MFSKIKKYFSETDYLLLLFAVLLSVIGITAIYSAGYDPISGETNAYFKRQLMWLFFGIISFFIMSYINYGKLVRFTPVLYIIGILILVAVSIIGHIGMGAQRWIGIGPLKLQPSEAFKIIIVIGLAWVFMDFDGRKMGILTLIKKFLYLLPPFLLVYTQPDLGTSVTYIAVWGIVVLILGVKKEVYSLAVIALIISTIVIWNNMHDYQKNRVKVFFGIIEDAQGHGYQLKQSKIAVGSGGITGKGFLGGTQANLEFLPETRTDFIYSVINEEYGLIGGTVIIVLFLLLLFRIFSISIKTKEPAGKIIAISVAAYIFFQFIINAGMTVGLVPIVGIPMPFVSYGGTSLLSFFTMLGLVNSVYLRRYTITE